MSIQETHIKRDGYSGQHICVLVPTKGRPEHVERLLYSMVRQTEPVGRIIIIASGIDIKKVIDNFIGELSIDYHFTDQTGQIRQRNLGIDLLDDRTSLVACIDDDIELDKDAISEMVKFWNLAPKNTAGVGFNIVNESSNKASILQQMLCLGHKEPGRVLRSGISTSISHLDENITSQWLNGGATVWRQNILIDNPHKEINTKWAIGEDLIFSYPIGKIYPLFVCAHAKVTHYHNPCGYRDNQWHYMHGKTQTLWVYYFVNNNHELSKTLFIIGTLMRAIGKLGYGLIMQKIHLLHFSRGTMAGVGIMFKHMLGLLKKGDIREY